MILIEIYGRKHGSNGILVAQINSVLYTQRGPDLVTYARPRPPGLIALRGGCLSLRIIQLLSYCWISANNKGRRNDGRFRQQTNEKEKKKSRGELLRPNDWKLRMVPPLRAPF